MFMVVYVSHKLHCEETSGVQDDETEEKSLSYRIQYDCEETSVGLHDNATLEE